MLGSFCPLHQGHLDIILRAKRENDAGCIVIVSGFEGDKGGEMLSLKSRYRRIRQFFNDDDLVSVYCIDENDLNIAHLTGEWKIWLDGANKILKNVISSETKRVWYVGEKEYADSIRKLDQTVIKVDRTENMISGTMIRENPLKYWDKITSAFKDKFSKNFLILGAAGEGKTNLVKDLSKYFNAASSYEWEKEYVERKGINNSELTCIDFIRALQNQYDLNKSILESPANNGLFISDSDALVTKMYAKYYSTKKSFILSEDDYIHIAIVADEIIKKSRWDCLFLLSPKNNFFDDETQYIDHFSIEIQNKSYYILLNEIKNAGLWNKVNILSGNYCENFIAAKEIIKRICSYR